MPRPPALAALLLALAGSLPGGPARAQVELGFYGGWQGAPSGGVALAGEESEGGGRAGIRATWWRGGDLGLGLEASRAGLSWGAAGGSAAVEGLGLLTVTGVRRWPGAFGEATPYLGAGLGLAVPDAAGGDGGAGPAVTLTAGASVPLMAGWAVFGEYQGAYAATAVEGEGGATLDAEAFTSGLNLGISFSF